MTYTLVAVIALISPLAFIITAIASWFQPGMRPYLIRQLVTVSSATGIITSGICGYLVVQNGLLETPFIGFYELGFSLRLDALSVLMFTMIALIAFIVVRFSINYLDGDKRQGIFLGRLAATIASVQFLVLAGNLGVLLLSWIVMSICLHRLLVFYKERPGAIIAARKKFILARLGDACLLVAIVLLYLQFNTGNLEVIFQAIQTSPSAFSIEAVAILLASAALLKSAQFPTHGWLIEVMETPTPVSALLHAGLLNAGPFLIVRMAFIMEASTYAPVVLIITGAFTALFASVVFLTQTSIKTALAYSSVAHMGFSLLVCGLGVYSAAMLHLVAHSFYKAHAFLSSGSVIDVIRGAKVKAARRIGSPIRIGLGILLGFLVYSAFAVVWGIDPVEELSLLAIGGIIIMGLSRLFTNAIDSDGSPKLILRATIMSLIVATSFFTLESGMHYILTDQMPALGSPGSLEIALLSIILLTFGTVVFIQILAPTLAPTPFYRALAIHLRNGLYVNTIFDRTVRALYSHETGSHTEIVRSLEHIKQPERVELEIFEEQLA
ncbi:NADH/ubiquinone/plastoquinone (complex i) [Fulvivirga sp. M361]|uniref:proton-conducting transporter transmembrane domain-containing protein n=1 Tax=Fulvivirga sp. M361 TaxID=2594266 RepID=UPI00117AA1EB|nr:proton-conducting transporter membrane subunit [Fulvivirga sp. M361]TRX58863.1 NADH/ubiquinone/plastoquinone (complex i) [Fulvivirga sp. M361]